jgi:hypothetical protein
MIRKYRVMIICGKLYPLLVAISSHWKAHYFTAHMAERAVHRAEDAEFLENMPAARGTPAMKAPASQAPLALDYRGIDLGVSGQSARTR